jgi:hypothetical protein
VVGNVIANYAEDQPRDDHGSSWAG